MSSGWHVLIAGGWHRRRTGRRAQEYVDREWPEERVKQRYERLFTYDATGVARKGNAKRALKLLDNLGDA